MSRQVRSTGKAKQSLHTQLIRHIIESRLPGDDPLVPGRLDEIAAFLCEAAMQRLPGETAIVLGAPGDSRREMRIAVINDDMPFLVDSIGAAVEAQGLVIDFLLHPVVPVRRDATGRLEALASTDDDGPLAESMIYIETTRIDARKRQDLKRALEVTLADVRAAVTDWKPMTRAMEADAARVTDPEGQALLQWLSGGMLTQLGHVTRHRDGRNSERLGICRKSARTVLSDASCERAFAWFEGRPGPASDHAPLIIKANHISKVHRAVPLDLFIVPQLRDGTIEALSIHAGIWTSAALNAPPYDVPRMRRRFMALTADLGFDPASHTGKALLHALTALPHDLLIGLDEQDVTRVAIKMSGLPDRPRPRLTLVEAPLARHMFVFVWLPRDMMSTAVRLRIEDLLETSTGADTLDWSLQIEGGAIALLRFVLDIRSSRTTPDETVLDEQLQVMLRGWTEAVENALAQTEEPVRAAALARRYADAFPLAYRSDYGAAEAAIDITRMRRLIGSEADPGNRNRDARLYALGADAPEQLRLKIYQPEGRLPLSDSVPGLEHFGFRVLAEDLTALDDGRIGTIHDFMLGLQPGKMARTLLDRAETIERALAAVLNHRAEDDPFNRLVPAVGLDVAEVEWLRAMYRYLRQTGLSFTVQTVVGALAGAADVTQALIALFRARHDPDVQNGGDAAERAREAIAAGLAEITAINDDRVLRLYQCLIEAIVRTNAFAPAAQEALALKIDCAQIPGLPKPLPWREIFVHSQRVEGVHLRSGPVARGGLRWSDRRDDFRSETLGLMKAQRVKNAVIVPAGAKGGFFPKQLPDPARDRDGWAAEGKATYEIFIRSLLSVTDNIVDGRVVHPERVMVLDGDDPYFVVAADKGTARFSDVANAIAEEQGFWLGDAFASGGSKGYDHKAMGITARGAWISVQRHFREMGIDVQNEPVRVVGCGDMSGDVFGNGMLLSRAIKLVAAFDHRHIFIDPDPDPARSWTERNRLFELPRSSWEDYDPKLISAGGGVWPRTLKRIPLSDQARAVLGLDAEELEPDRVISAILAAPVDLVWFGGIGTYIKASTETDADVGDPGNDALRIDATRLRAKVIGEGANLAVTQAARIEFALAGGRINTDFIDNSAGVDSSDAEVNIKIALSTARGAGRLSERRRDALLKDMTEQVAALVLEDNRLQALALSIAERCGVETAAAQVRLIQLLETSGDLDRETEGLADEETFARRVMDGKGLTRPELALLLSTTKLVLQNAIEESSLPDDPGLEDLLLEAFPEMMRERHAPAIRGHRLRREIISTRLANRIVNRLGMVRPFELAEEGGVSLAQVAAAFVAAERLFNLDMLWHKLDTADMEESARLLLFDQLAGAVRIQVADLLRAGVGRTDSKTIEQRLRNNIALVGQHVDTLLQREARARSESLLARLIEQGAPEPEARGVVHLYDLDGSVGIAQLAVDVGIEPLELAQIFVSIGARLGLDWAQGTAAMMAPSDPWERLLVAGLARDLQQLRLDFLHRVTRGGKAKRAPAQAVIDWAQNHPIEIDQFRALIARARASTPVSPAMLAHIAGQARNLFAL